MPKSLPSAYHRGEWLVPEFETLKAQIMGAPSTWVFDDRTEYVLEQFPYCLGAASYAILEMIRVQHLTVIASLARSSVQTERVVFVLDPTQRERMGFLVDSFLEAACRAQNALGLLIGKAMSTSLPNSMSDLAKRLRSESGLLGELSGTILEYWDRAGARLRQYRDLSQHFAVVSSDARVFVVSGEPRIYFVLPNNPEVKSVRNLKYEEPYVDAAPFLFEQFKNLVEVGNRVCRALLDPAHDARVGLVSQTLKGPIRVGPPPHGRVAPTVEQAVKNLRQHLKRLPEPIGLA